MPKIKLVLFFVALVLIGAVGLYLTFRQYFGVPSFEVYAGWLNENKLLNSEVSFALKPNIKYNLAITIINNGSVVLRNVTIELIVPEGFTVPKHVGIVGDIVSGDGVGYVFSDITTPPTPGTYRVEIKVSSGEISHTFKLQIILEKGDS